MRGSFTNDYGSSLTPSNIDITGKVHDLETFHAERVWTGSVRDYESGNFAGNSRTFKEFGDGMIDKKYFLEDLRLSIEALERYLQICGMYGQQTMKEGVIEAWRSYTGEMIISTDTRCKIMQLFAECFSNKSISSTINNVPSAKYASLSRMFLSHYVEELNYG